MYAAFIIAIKTDDYNKLLEDTIKFIKECSTNGLKILSFLSITNFLYYAKTFGLTGDEQYAKDKWLPMLKDQIMDGDLDKYIQSIVNKTDKKRFIVMLLQYENMNMDKNMYGYNRLRELDDCYITKLDHLPHYIPGEVPDQLFIISFDFFNRSFSWTTILQDVCSSFLDCINVNLFSSFYYFVMNDSDMYKNFVKKTYDVEQITQFAKNIGIAF
jgi:hypothetical protein